MTHQNHLTNGASLEDCHTNFFALTDLCGIKWRKLVLGERPNATGDPLEDPVLSSYARCLAADILCVWRRVAVSKQEPDSSANLFDLNLTLPGGGSVTHPPLALTAAKELWIFWYGEEPDLSELVAPVLRKSSEGSSGSWEGTISYECRSLLFKALHNLIERCLMSKDVVRLGRWFVQPCSNNECRFGKSPHHLSYSFAFFVHGESTVCASMDLRVHPTVRPLTPEYLAEAAAQQHMQHQQHQQNPPPSSASVGNGRTQSTVPNSTSNPSTNDIKPKPVILAPFGLAGTLTGQSFRVLDAANQKSFDDWCSFYPLCNRENASLPPMVEVLTGGVKMRYPSKYVLTTDLDAEDYETACKSVPPLPVTEKAINDLSNPGTMHAAQLVANVLPERIWQDCIANPLGLSTTAITPSLSSPGASATGRPSLPSNVLATSSPVIKEEHGLLQNIKHDCAAIDESNPTGPWNFIDPTQKSNCSCTKCRRPVVQSSSGRTTSSSFHHQHQHPTPHGGNFSSPSQGAASQPLYSSSFSGQLNSMSSGGSNILKPSNSQRPDKSTTNSRVVRVPFHKRQPHDFSASLSFLADSHVVATTASGATTGCSPDASVTTSPSSSLSTNSQRPNAPTGACTPGGGSMSYSRNPHSIPDTAIPSVGSPGSAAPSPHPNSAMSQPTSVPPSDQMCVISPIPPTSASNMQPSTPLDGNSQLDKNTPAATPTGIDQNDCKSTVASPYVMPAPPSVEPPPPSLLEQFKIKSETGGNEGNTSGNGGGSSSGSSNSSSSCSSANNTPNASTCAVGINPIASIGPKSAAVNPELRSIKLLKRPMLSSRENFCDDDHAPQALLYDYSTWDAWLNHPVKRHKPNEERNTVTSRLRKDLYQGHHFSSSTVSASAISTDSSLLDNSSIIDSTSDKLLSEQLFKTEPTAHGDGLAATDELLQDIKKEPIDSESTKPTENYFNVGDLLVTDQDLEQIFDEENSNGSPSLGLVQTPPRSNKSQSGAHDPDTKRYISGSLNHTSMHIELTKMFPTPPSLEHPNSSPCGASGGIFDHQLDHLNSPSVGLQEEEEIDDWSYVFVPPTVCKFLGSSKYAPLNNLPSQVQSTSQLSHNFTYKPSWQIQQQLNASNNNNNSNATNNNIHAKNLVPVGPDSKSSMPFALQQALQDNQQPPHQPQQQLVSVGPSSIGNILTPRPLSRPSSVHSIPGFGGPSPGGPLNNHHHPGMRPDMSPISPAPGAPYSSGSPMNPYRRPPNASIPPPPPYELAVASPATSTSSYLNKQFHSVDATPTLTIPSNRVPEANALLLNVLLYDTALNVFKDHNFESSSLCVCNAGNKCVGNIRGSDSGVYLALPGTSFEPSNLYNNTSSTGSSNSNNCFGTFGLDSPEVGNSNATSHNVGYHDDDPIKCSCGFSAVVNRRLSHRSGLFFEDEMEITGMAEDPLQYKRKSILSLVLGDKNNAIKMEGGQQPNDRFAGNPADGSCDMMVSATIMDLLQEQITLIQSSSSSIQRAIRCFQSLVTLHSRENSKINMLEYTDAQDIIWLALDQCRLVFETQSANRMELTPFKPFKYSISGHRWPYVKAEGPRSNKDIVRIMKSMQPLLQDAFHKKCTTRLWDAPYTVQGPLTWRQFHRMASSSSGQCEPQPIPSVVVGHEQDWLSVSPYAIQYWDKFMLEPYSYSRDIAYIVLAPDNDYVVSRTKHFFKELSTTYEMCKLGRHTPMKGWDGILRVGKSTNQPAPVKSNISTNHDGLDEWFASLGDSKTSDLLKLYAQTCQQQLVPYLSKIPNDKSLLDPPEGNGSSSSSSSAHKDRSLPSPMIPPNTPDPSQHQQGSSGDKAPSTPKPLDTDADNLRDSSLNSSANQPTVEPLGHCQDEINPPCIVIYVVDPFSSGYDSADHKRVTCLALLRCYANILASIPESVRSNINFQIISMESVMELGRSRDRTRFSDEMRCLALSIFSQCRRHLTHSANVKSLTGFGTAANMEIFLKNKDDKNRAAYKLYTPPYILSGRHEKSENTEMFGTTSIEQQSSIMYCSYCLSEDQRWLLAAATDDRGELLETITINIDIPNRLRRKKASARRMGLQKLMDFMIGVISQSGQPWRIVVGRIGRIGHGELKGWSWLLSKQNLLKASKQLKDVCDQCSYMHSHSVPSILSACLVTLEPDSNLRVMPDKFTPDERFSQTSMQSPLSTPQDVTCTHILVFPTSAIAQSSQVHFQEQQHINDVLDSNLFDGMNDGDDDVNMNDIFSDNWDTDQIPQNSPERSRQGSPNGMDDIRSHNSFGQGDGRCTGRNGYSQDSEEVGQCLQQPMALGYLVSTAPTGRMPKWFWASCPHLENVCPVFLKTALHLHSPSIQQNTDDLLQQNQSSANDHPLDSTYTADVLRYVLEGYNVLSWLAMDSNTHDRLSCLPIHVQVLMQLYYMTAAMA